jgi:hypothetical protein
LDLVDPFNETVVFGKAHRSSDGTYRRAWPPAGATSVSSLLPTGRHVSHANALVHVKGKKTKGRNANNLEVYRKSEDTTANVLAARATRSGARFQSAGVTGRRLT